MPEDINMAANVAEPTEVNAEAVAEPVTTQDPVTTEPQKQAEPQLTETQAFSRRLKEAQAEWQRQKDAEAAAERDALIVEVYGGQFKNYGEYKAALDQQRMQDEAQKRGIDPALYEQMTATERKAAEAEAKAAEAMTQLNSYRRREELAQEAETMAADPKWGPFFTANRDEIMRIASEIDGNGITPQMHINAARLIALENTWQPPDEKAIKEAGVKEYLAALKGQNVPAEGRGGQIPSTAPAIKDPWKKADATADSYLRSRKL